MSARELTVVQRRWLTEMVGQDSALKVPTGTAQGLLARRLAQPFGSSGLWVATDDGRELVVAWERGEAFKAATSDFTPGAYEFSQRVVGWIRVLRLLDGGSNWWTYSFEHHAGDIARLRFARRDPLPSAEVHGEWHDWIVSTVDDAIQVLAEYDEAREASDSVHVTFAVAKGRAPRPRADAARDAAKDDGTVSIARFRAQRGGAA